MAPSLIHSWRRTMGRESRTAGVTTSGTKDFLPVGRVSTLQKSVTPRVLVSKMSRC